MKAAIFGLLAAALASPALASGSHEGGHDEVMAVGEPGKKADVTQTIRVTMKETDDGQMIFAPSDFQVREGQTVRFAIKNAGELEHEFVLDQQDKVMEHKAAMEKFPDMEHEDPNAIRLTPESPAKSSGNSPMPARSRSRAWCRVTTTRACTAT